MTRIVPALVAFMAIMAVLLVSAPVTAKPICVLADVGICVDESVSTIDSDNLGFDGTQTSCDNLGGTIVQDTDFYGGTAINSCGSRCCCNSATGQPRANGALIGATETCGSSAFVALPVSAVNPNTPGFSCNTVCGGSPITPPPPSCAVGAAATVACSCGTGTANVGETCCAATGTGTIVSAGQTCGGTPPPPPTPCVAGQGVTASCTCGAATATAQDVAAGRICCSAGVIAATQAACPVTLPPSSLCGNNILNAGEQCDAPAVLPANPPASLPRCPTATDTCTAACTCIPAQTITCGDGVCSAGEMTFCATNPRGTVDCQTTPACTGTGVPAVGGLGATFVNGNVQLSWTLPLQCTPLDIRIGRSTTSLIPPLTRPTTLLPSGNALPPTTTTFTDNALPARSTSALLSYRVILNYPNGQTANTSIDVMVPTLSCPTGAASYCKTSTIALTCDPSFGATEIDCSRTPGSICSVINNVAQCVKTAIPPTTPGAQACDQCNGLFGMYRDPSALITEGSIPIGGADVQRACSAALTCYVDLRDTSVELYSSCSSISSCTGYRTQASCTRNQCGKPGTCGWNPVNPSDGLGRGVCTPQQTTFIPSACGDCATAGGGTCTRTICETIGKAAGASASLCAYIDPATGTSGGLTPTNTGCVPATEMPCEFYTDQDQCEGPTGARTTFQLDTQYSGTTRTGVTNKVNSLSGDVAGHGKCVWAPFGGSTSVCRKDADKDGIADTSQYTAGQNSWTLSLDFTSPTTTILGPTSGSYGRDVSIPFSTDGTLKAILVQKTTATQTAYPVDGSLIRGNTIQRQFTAAESGQWTLFYYAVDDARNLELLKSYDFTVDGAPPIITVTSVNKTIIRTTLTGRPEFRQRTIVNFTVSERATCTSSLLDIDGNTIPAAARGGANTDLTGQTGTQFSITFPALADGSYLLDIKCTDSVGNPSAFPPESITANTDSTIFNPFPVAPTKPTNVTQIAISIETTKPARCAYGPVGTPHASKTPYTITGGLLHNATVTVPGSGLYTYETSCDIAGTIATGDASDLIVFVVDNTAPTTILCDANLVGCEPIDFVTPKALYRIATQCTDGPVGTPNFGCKPTLICAAAPTAIPCTPTARTLPDLDGTKDWVVRYHSIDNGNNAEAISTVRIAAKDVVPPLAPTFSILP